MSFFDILFGKPILPANYTVSQPTKMEEEVVYGIFEYQCKISCPSLENKYFVTVTVQDSITEPETKCPCGRKLTLPPAPIVKKRLIGDKVHESRRGEFVYTSFGDGHSVYMGKTFRYEPKE